MPQDRPLHAEKLPRNDWSWRVPAFLSMPDANKNNSKETVFPFFVSKKILRNWVKLLKLLVSRAASLQVNTPQPIYFLLRYIFSSNWHVGQSIKPMGKSQRMHQWGHYKHGCNQRAQKVKECLISHKASKNLFPIPPSSASSLASPSSPPTPQLQSPTDYRPLRSCPFCLELSPPTVDWLTHTCDFIPNWDVASSRKPSLTHTKTGISASPPCPPSTLCVPFSAVTSRRHHVVWLSSPH